MRLKEKIIIALIVIMTVLLALVPILKENKNNDTLEPSDNNIKIIIEGEINALDKNGDITNKMTIIVPSGTTYGYIISRINIYLTRYSIIDDNLKLKYYNSTKIKIESSNKTLNINSITKGKICLNTASKKELMTINGIKEQRALKIIEYRQNKRIESYTELKNILGLSDDAIENIKKQAFL